jgi:hypothetical protein
MATWPVDTHENEVLAPPATTTVSVVRGTNDAPSGNMVVGNPAQWKLDKAHCSVLWQTNYLELPGY